MTNAEILAAVQILLRQLVPDVATTVAPPPPAVNPTVGNTPGGMVMGVYNGPTVAVRPTGVLAQGVVRWWPVVQPNETRFSDYLWRMTGLKREDGLPYVPAQYRAQLSTLISSAGYGRPFGPDEFPWRADCFSYPEEWRTQAQIDQTARDEAGWVATHRRMQNGGDDAPGAGGSV